MGPDSELVDDGLLPLLAQLEFPASGKQCPPNCCEGWSAEVKQWMSAVSKSGRTLSDLPWTRTRYSILGAMQQQDEFVYLYQEVDPKGVLKVAMIDLFSCLSFARFPGTLWWAEVQLSRHHQDVGTASFWTKLTQTTVYGAPYWEFVETPPNITDFFVSWANTGTCPRSCDAGDW